MMRWIIGSSLQLRFLVVAVAAVMVFFGVSRIRDMPVDVFPEFAPPLVEIQTEALGLSTTEVEAFITVPLEYALSGLPSLDTIRSKSVPGLASNLLIFKPGTDLMHARQMVHERLTTAIPVLPNVSRPPVMLQPLSATSRVMKIGLSSKDMSLIDMSTVTRWKIRPRLMSVPGVANVAVWGNRKRQIQVQVEPRRLASLGITLDRIMKVTSDAMDIGLLSYSSGSSVGTGGLIETPNQRLEIRHALPIAADVDLAQVPVKVVNGVPLTLGDVAAVVEHHPPMIGDAIINDGPGLLLIVEKFPWANTLDVTRGVEEAMDLLRPALANIEVDTTIFRPATYIEMSISNLTNAMIIGSILVILVLGAFLFEWRTALISVIAIPLSLVAAGLVLYLRDVSINVMILAGLVIALGAVVDDAIIDIENILRRLRQHRKEGSKKSTMNVILEASLEVRSAIVYATLIIVAAVLPVFFMEGLSGAFFRPLAFSYMLAILASLVVALTVTPALSLILLENVPLAKSEPRLVQWLHRIYNGILVRATRSPRPAYITVGVIALIGVAVVPWLGQTLLPSFKERDFLMHWVTKPGTSHAEMNRITIQASKELRTIPGVRNFGAHVGRAAEADEVVGINFTENWISVDPSADYDKTLSSIEGVVNGYPGLYRDVQTYLKERIREVLSGANQPIVVRIFGSDLDILRSKAKEIKEIIATIDGVVDPHVELQVEIPHIAVEVDLAAAARYGLKPGDVRRAAATLIAGLEVGDVYRDGKVFDVNVYGTAEVRHSLTSLGDLLIDAPKGGQVQLKDIARISVAPMPNVVKRERNSRRIDVETNVRGRDLGAVVRDIQTRLQQVNFPSGHYPEILGEYAERKAAEKSMYGYTAIAVITIFFLLQAAVGSWRLATLIFLTLPSALVGGVLAAVLGGGVISLGSLVGFLTVFGIAARNGIMLICHYRHLEEHEGITFGLALVLRGAQERLTPILMTAIVTGIALLPLVFSGNLPGHEIEHPMAVVILGGLVTSTLLNLIVVPALYLRFGQRAAEAPVMAVASA